MKDCEVETKWKLWPNLLLEVAFIYSFILKTLHHTQLLNKIYLLLF